MGELTERPERRGWFHRYGWSVVAVAGLLAYSNCFQGQPFLDDFSVLADTATEAERPDGWVPQPLTPRWLGNWSFVVGFAAFGDGFRAAHAVNLAIHIAAAIVLWALVVRTLCSPRLRARFADRAGGLATAAAVLWVVHPLTTSAVTYLTQRYESLMGLFVLVAVWCAARGAGAPARRTVWCALAVASAYAASATKEPAVALPVVIAVYDRLFLSNSWREVAGKKWPLYLGLIAAQAALLPMILATTAVPAPPERPSDPSRAGAVETEPNEPPSMTAGFSTVGVSPWEYLRSQPGVLLHYLRLSAVPVPLVLDYGWPVARWWWQIWPPGAVVVVLVCATGWGVWRGAAGSVLGVWFFGFLALTSSFVPIIDLAFEHRMYLPLMAVVTAGVLGAEFALSWLATRTGRSGARLKVGALVIVGTIFAALTYDRNEDYQDEVRMYRQTLLGADGNDRVWNNLGAAHLVKGRYAEAADAFHEATRRPSSLKPFIHDLAWRNLLLALERGRSEDLVPVLTEYVAEDPENPSRRFKLARAELEARNVAGAVAQYRRAFEIADRTGVPVRDPMVFWYYGQALSDSGEPEAAVAEYRRALLLQPVFPPVHNKMGQELTRLGRYAEAETHLRAAAEQQPQAPNGPQNLAVLRMHQGKPGEAIPLFREALRRDPQLLTGVLGLAQALDETGQTAESRRTFATAGQLSRDWVQKTAELSWQMSTHWDARARYAVEGLRLARMAVAGGGDAHPRLLDVLAAALAENGRFEEAERTAARAAEAARPNSAVFASQIEQRRALYARRLPYRQSRPGPR